jgi:hypothetical protein
MQRRMQNSAYHLDLVRMAVALLRARTVTLVDQSSSPGHHVFIVCQPLVAILLYERQFDMQILRMLPSVTRGKMENTLYRQGTE